MFGTPLLARAEEKPDAKKPPLPGNRVDEQLGREGMWPAPTAEDWAKPVLIRFQRTWEDAIAISKETGRPILICINMDGEIASEHYAGVRYRQPQVAELYKPYVCVAASVYRHTPRDYDDEGRRVVCPRLGSVTCGEHIALETVIYEKYCDGKRIAPRHIAVDLTQDEVYDVYYLNDTAGVFEKVRDGVDHLPPPKPPIVRGDRPVVERVASRHVEDREAVEAAYQNGDEAMRSRLLEAAARHPDAAPIDLLRLGVFGLDAERAREARGALARTTDPSATTLISEALQAPVAEDQREALIATLQRLGGESTLAAWLARVHRGMATQSSVMDYEAWAKRAQGVEGVEREGADVLAREVEDLARAAEARPEDAEAHLRLAEQNLELAMEAPRRHPHEPRLARRMQEHLCAEAHEQAQRAEALGAESWRVQTVLTLAAYYGGDAEKAYGHAERAVREIPAGDPNWRSMAVITIHAESRWQKIKAAVKAKQEWPAEWLADVHADYAALLHHPLGNDGHATWHFDFLVWLGAERRADGVLRAGLGRFPESAALHQRLRDRVLQRHGVDELDTVYARLRRESEPTAALEFFSGEAAVAAADQHRQARAWPRAMDALEAAAQYFDEAARLDPAYRDPAARAAALALGARARVAYQVGEDDRALEDVLAALTRAPDATGTRDSMGFTPGETAQMLLARLRSQNRTAMVERLERALGAIDPALLEYDR